MTGTTTKPDTERTDPYARHAAQIILDLAGDTPDIPVRRIRIRDAWYRRFPQHTRTTTSKDGNLRRVGRTYINEGLRWLERRGAIVRSDTHVQVRDLALLHQFAQPHAINTGSGGRG